MMPNEFAGEKIYTITSHVVGGKAGQHALVDGARGRGNKDEVGQLVGHY